MSLLFPTLNLVFLFRQLLKVIMPAFNLNINVGGPPVLHILCQILLFGSLPHFRARKAVFPLMMA
jgi:hypothetical protein